MSLSRVSYPADGTTDTFTVPFGYLSRTHVKVTVNGFPQVLPPIWTNPSTLQLQDGVPPDGALVEIYRQTPTTALVTFNDGALLPAGDLNLAETQSLYLAQELTDRLDVLVAGGLQGIPGGGTFTGNTDDLIYNLTQSILDSSLLASLQARYSDIDTNAEAILEQTARADAHQTLLDLLGSANFDNSAFILNTSTIQVDGTTSLADKLSGMVANIDTNTAAIATEETARADADSALASQISILVAGSATFYVQPTAPTSPNVGDVWYDSDDGNHPYKWDGSTWIDVRDGLFTTLGAEITTEQTARIDGDTALATDITDLTTVVDGNTADISTQLTSINGLEAQYTVKTDVNGYVAGFGLANFTNNDGTHTSQFEILADQFAVIFPVSKWAASHAYAVGALVKPLAHTGTGFIFKATAVTGNSASSEPTWPVVLNGTVVDGGVTWKAINPDKQVPFVVGSVNGVSTIGIDGSLVVDGTITADAIDVTNLSAISAAMGTVTGGLFRTATSGFRAEIGNDTSFPLWLGTGGKSAGNAVFYVDTSGVLKAKNINITGTANVQTGTMISGSILDTSSLRIDTGGGRRASPVVEDMTSDFNSTPGNLTVLSGIFKAPDNGAGFSSKRFVDNVMDVFFDVFATGDGGTELVSIQRKYDSGAWTNITTYSPNFTFYGSGNLKFRFTTHNNGWNQVQFRAITSNGLTLNLAMSLRVYNFGASGNTAGSVGGTGGTSGGGTDLDPKNPPGTYVP